MTDDQHSDPEVPDQHPDSDPEDPEMDTHADDGVDAPADLSVDTFHDVLEHYGRPVVTAAQVARVLECSHEAADDALSRLTTDHDVERLSVESDPVVWYPKDWAAVPDRERVVPFPKRREILVDQPSQFTRAQLSQFAHLVDTNRNGGYLYEIRQEDIWQAPYESLADLIATMRLVLPERSPLLEEWVEDQWSRAHKFKLSTHEDGYVVLEAENANLMGNVARQKLDDGQLRAPMSDTESWVAEAAVSEVKRILYEAGYPVQDERDLDEGEPLDVDLRLDLRSYQRHWVEEFIERKSGVLVGPPGSGKTVAALGILEAVGGETLILVPSRELASQWRDELLAHTTLHPDEIGEYHGGKKEVRSVTIATYQTAGMDRHRQLFDQRKWGLIVYDEVHHIPSNVYRRSADLQTKHRLGLSATPVREDDREKDIFTLIGSPIGTDWDALFEEGYVQEPEVEIRYVPWDDEVARNEYVSSEGHERRQLASMNPAKEAEVSHLLRQHPDKKALIFVDYLDQGRDLAATLDVPFVSGETPHSRRETLFDQFRTGMRDTLIVSRIGDEGLDLPDAELAILGSGLGGSRRQGAQRAGRTMRPVGNALVFVLATRGTAEEDFARQQMRHLAAKGVQVREAAGATSE